MRLLVRAVHAAALACLAAMLPGGPAASAAGGETMAAPRTLGTVGLYITPPGAGQGHYYDFYRACGYNYLEFCEGGFGVRPDGLPKYYADMASVVADAHRSGFKVWILLLAGMKQWKGPAESGSAGTFSALDKPQLEERLSYLRRAVEGLRGADGFEFFAGDPGGDPEGRSTVKDCVAFAKRVHGIVREVAPKAGFAVNLWAVAEWAGFPSPFKLEFWQKQVQLSRTVAADRDLLGPDCGIVFSLDNYYRSLTLMLYAQAHEKPPLFPGAADVRGLHDRGVRPVFGWPYFLVDEIDDGYITPNNVVSKGQAGSETRYIRAIVDHARAIGLDGLVANAAYVAAEPLNIYAFARMYRVPGLTPGAVLDEWAGIVADDATKGRLARVLRFVENHGNWQNSLPAQCRLKDLPCDLATPQAAIALLETVVPRDRPRIVLPEPPAAYLARVRSRLETIARGEIGGPNPYVVPPKG